MVNKQKGMTIIELMFTVAILSIIILGLVTFFTGSAKSWITGQSQLEAQRNARQAMESMVREIRHGETADDSSTSTSIVFNTPFNGSPDINYYLDTGTGILYRNANPIIDDVLSLSFAYIDNIDNVIPTSDSEFSNKVSKIHINLQVDIDGDSNPDITLNSDIDLRNFDL
ncbi:MAG: prepilin-type N-terminal cleavage/methylation domain-containing protein [Actinobacteria bacterium]|nr:prepilin-type N-terminal cleavage/methylation domain-containing protein [Actinomycetota bacterium]